MLLLAMRPDAWQLHNIAGPHVAAGALALTSYCSDAAWLLLLWLLQPEPSASMGAAATLSCSRYVRQLEFTKHKKSCWLAEELWQSQDDVKDAMQQANQRQGTGVGNPPQ